MRAKSGTTDSATVVNITEGGKEGKKRKTTTGYHQGKYSPDSFVIPGQDNNGNSTREWCQVTPLLDRAIVNIFYSRKFPFRSKGDLIRYCLKTGVDRLEEMEPVTGSVLAQVDAMIAILQDEAHHHAFMTVFNTMAGTVGMHIQAQALGEARRVIAMMRVQIDKIDNEYWRGRYIKEMDTRFGYLLTNVTGAGLGDHVDSGPDQGGVDEDDEGDD